MMTLNWTQEQLFNEKKLDVSEKLIVAILSMEFLFSIFGNLTIFVGIYICWCRNIKITDQKLLVTQAIAAIMSCCIAIPMEIEKLVHFFPKVNSWKNRQMFVTGSQSNVVVNSGIIEFLHKSSGQLQHTYVLHVHTSRTKLSHHTFQHPLSCCYLHLVFERHPKNISFQDLKTQPRCKVEKFFGHAGLIAGSLATLALTVQRFRSHNENLVQKFDNTTGNDGMSSAKKASKMVKHNSYVILKEQKSKLLAFLKNNIVIILIWLHSVLKSGLFAIFAFGMEPHYIYRNRLICDYDQNLSQNHKVRLKIIHAMIYLVLIIGTMVLANIKMHCDFISNRQRAEQMTKQARDTLKVCNFLS